VHSVAQTIGARLWNHSAILGALVAAMVAVFGSPVRTQTMVDGDTIKLNSSTYRLWGIDPAESKQTCADAKPGPSREICEVLSSGCRLVQESRVRADQAPR
jgi:endonuclease YncB( thermonuclease family)